LLTTRKKKKENKGAERRQAHPTMAVLGESTAAALAKAARLSALR
jgi:hypothetical protein